jgi:hypothetical protein
MLGKLNLINDKDVKYSFLFSQSIFTKLGSQFPIHHSFMLKYFLLATQVRNNDNIFIFISKLVHLKLILQYLLKSFLLYSYIYYLDLIDYEQNLYYGNELPHIQDF